MAPTIASYALVALLAIFLYYALPFVWRATTTPLRHVPGPPSPSLLWGNLKIIQAAENSVPQEQWAAQYGPTIAYRGIFGVWRLWTLDTKALNHVLTHTATYQKAAAARYHLARIVGPGLLVAEDEQHKNQRRVLNPAFGPAQVREITEIFVEKSNQLRDLWFAEITKAGGTSARVDALSWLSRATLDMIGLAGFNYAFNALNPAGEINELNAAFSVLFSPNNNQQLFPFLQGLIPPLRLIRTTGNRRQEHAQSVMRRIGLQLIAEKKEAVLAQSREKGRDIGRNDLKDRDLLTLLIKANLATDIPESQRLTDEEVLAQVPTFIVAGHETTSTATMWCLYALSIHPDVQRKLREELLEVPTENPSMDELNALPYLDMVVKETLRHHAPVPATNRTVVHDDIIPLDTPFTDRNGKVCDHVRVRKGDMIFIPILSINRSKALWGEDAHEFKPERWEHPPEHVSSIPGVWGHLLSFLGGPRACIGYRFSLVETKALLFALVRAFEFELAVKQEDVKKRSGIVQRPVIHYEGEKGSKVEMPLNIKPYRA